MGETRVTGLEDWFVTHTVPVEGQRGRGVEHSGKRNREWWWNLRDNLHVHRGVDSTVEGPPSLN